MMENIKKLGLLGEMLNAGNSGKCAVNLNIYELAHITHLLGGIDFALATFDSVDFWTGRNAEVMIFDDKTIGSFEVVNAIFNWVANEIMYTRLHLDFRYNGEGYEGSIDISDDEDDEIEKLKSKLMFEYNGDFENIKDLAQKYIEIYMTGSERTYEFYHGVYNGKLYVILVSWD